MKWSDLHPPLDNSELVAKFAPEVYDGDTFIYTEMLDRGKRKGNNGQRLLKTFYHRSRDEFWEQWPTIKRVCDLSQVRACTRLAPRSFKSVGRYFTRLVVDTAMSENWAGMKTLYNRACGCTAPITKVWLFDVDNPDETSKLLGEWLVAQEVLLATIPSKKGLHYITKPLDLRPVGGAGGDGVMTKFPNVQLHKDNPTNLYIPDGAD